MEPATVKQNKEELALCLGNYAQRGLFTHAYAELFDLREGRTRIAVRLGESEAEYFDLASLTKVLVLAPLVLEAFDLEDRLKSLPGTLPKAFGELKVGSLLRHASGLPAWHNFWIERFANASAGDEAFSGHPLPAFADLAERHAYLERLFQRISQHRQREAQPCYSDVGYILLCYLLEQHHRRRLDEIFRSWSAQNLQNLSFAPLSSSCVPYGFSALRGGSVRGFVHDENAYALDGVSGHAGLFARAEHLGAFVQALLQSRGGAKMWENSLALQAEDASLPYYVGLHPMTSEASQVFGSGRSLGHLGFTGTGLWIDPASMNLALILCNKTIHERQNPLIKPFRKEMLTLLEQQNALT